MWQDTSLETMSAWHRATAPDGSSLINRDGLQLVHTSGKLIADVARELGIYDSELGIGRNQARRRPAQRPGHRHLLADLVESAVRGVAGGGEAQGIGHPRAVSLGHAYARDILRDTES